MHPLLRLFLRCLIHLSRNNESFWEGVSCIQQLSWHMFDNIAEVSQSEPKPYITLWVEDCPGTWYWVVMQVACDQFQWGPSSQEHTIMLCNLKTSHTPIPQWGPLSQFWVYLRSTTVVALKAKATGFHWLDRFSCRITAPSPDDKALAETFVSFEWLSLPTLLWLCRRLTPGLGHTAYPK